MAAASAVMSGSDVIRIGVNRSSDDLEIPWPHRRHGVADFGESEFGYHPDKRLDFTPFCGKHQRAQRRSRVRR